MRAAPDTKAHGPSVPWIHKDYRREIAQPLLLTSMPWRCHTRDEHAPSKRCATRPSWSRATADRILRRTVMRQGPLGQSTPRKRTALSATPPSFRKSQVRNILKFIVSHAFLTHQLALPPSTIGTHLSRSFPVAQHTPENKQVSANDRLARALCPTRVRLEFVLAHACVGHDARHPRCKAPSQKPRQLFVHALLLRPGGHESLQILTDHNSMQEGVRSAAKG